MSGNEDADERRRYQAPYNAKHPIPTISKYREEKAARQEYAQQKNSGVGRAADYDDNDTRESAAGDGEQAGGALQQDEQEGDAPKDTSEVDPNAADPRELMKNKNRKKERAEREVTDPVTHLPVKIQDFTDEALQEADLDSASPHSTGIQKTTSGLSDETKQEKLRDDTNRLQQEHATLRNRFPPPDFDDLRQELSTITQKGVTAGLVGAFGIVGVAIFLGGFLRNDQGKLSAYGKFAWITLLAIGVGASCILALGVRDWISKRVEGVFDDEVWAAQRQQIKQAANQHEKETTVWLNSLLGSVWPMINPDLFAALGDTLEDVMQASLPKLVRMVSVDDIGQGSESIRILGVRWLPAGAATESVTEDGNLSSAQRTNEGKEDKAEAGQSSDDGVQAGMEAEDGEFINLEVAFAYRSRSSSDSLKEKSNDMHLYLAFYLPGNIKFPVWVDLRGMIGTMRLRLQLTPDPPFFELCTLTFLGQPKVNLSCTPLTKRGLNIMDVPFISNFVQSSIDAAVSQYVAPRSLMLNLKDMLAGEDFKKDTAAKGILMVHIRKGYDFKMADTGVPLIKDGSSDPYVSVGWAKFGKVLWSTRIMISEMEPVWEEICYVLVTPEEINVEERLRVQLWDSDRVSADDDLGRIEVDLKDIMKNKESNGKMWHRTDGFRALKPGDNMPGKLEWSVGYFSKTRLQDSQFEQQTYDPEIRSTEQLKQKVSENCERKLRELLIKGDSKGKDRSELEQQKEQELKATEDAMIISAPPPDGYPSGLFSLQIHNIMGLELGQLSKDDSGEQDDTQDEAETGDNLPSAYCTIIVNHRKAYKTRTKPQNSKPFYNAGCERFIGDWRECEAYVAVRDSRIDEEDPLLGIVHLPLYEVFKESSQVMGTWPLAGGVGHGKIRLSMVWRSVQLQAPRNLLGWDYGTLEVHPTATCTDLADNLRSSKLKFKTNLGMGKMYPQKEDQTWHTKKDQKMRLAVHKRYASCLAISFRNKGVFGEDIAAFSVLWLKDVVDEEEGQEIELGVWKGDYKRATTNVLDEPGEKLGTMKFKVTFWAGLVCFTIMRLRHHPAERTQANNLCRERLIPSGLTRMSNCATW